jgi:hypothetical protein
MSLAAWKKKLAFQTRPATIAYQVRATRKIYARLGPWLRKYRGGLPVGVFTAFMQYESNGKMSAPGDQYLGEVGYYQITKTTPGRWGLPAKSRFDPETNVFLGGMEYNEEAARYSLLYPQIRLGTPDNWKIARLVFAVGRGGTKRLINGARKMKPLVPGNVYGSIIDYVDKVGGIDLGRGQPAAKVWFRVHMVPVAYSVGQRAIPGYAERPRLLPPQPGVVNYSVSAPIRAIMLPAIAVNRHAGSGFLPVVVGATALGLLIAATKGR